MTNPLIGEHIFDYKILSVKYLRDKICNQKIISPILDLLPFQHLEILCEGFLQKLSFLHCPAL